MSGYIDELERELVRTGKAHYRHGTPLGQNAVPLRWRPRIGDMVAILAVGFALAIGALAIVLLGHSRHSSPSTNRPAASAGTRGLVSELSVLRRPQTAADRLSPSVASRLELNAGPLVPGLTRAVSVDGIRFYLVVSHPTVGYMRSSFTRFSAVAQGPWWPSSSGDLILLTGGPSFLPQLPVPAGELRDAEAVSEWIVTADQRRYLAEIVPDGVARVRVSFRGGTATATVRDNVAVTRAPANSNEVVKTITWYAPNGAVMPTIAPADDALRTAAIATQRTGIRAIVTQQAAAIPNHAPVALLHDFAVFATPSSHTVSGGGITISRPSLSSLPLVTLQQLDNPRAVREIHSRSGLTFWADPGPARVQTSGQVGGIRESTHICLREASSPSAGNCVSSLSRALEDGIWAATTAVGSGRVIYGIVPDTNTTIVFHLAGRATRAVPVIDGVVITSAAGVRAISVRGEDRTLRTMPIPGLTRYGG